MTRSIFCPRCLKKVAEEPYRIGFREVCSFCDLDLHTCSNCRFYAPGKPNDCMVPGTEYVRDREANNFCDEFKVKIELKKEDKKNNFNSLFKDNED